MRRPHGVYPAVAGRPLHVMDCCCMKHPHDHGVTCRYYGAQVNVCKFNERCGTIDTTLL